MIRIIKELNINEIAIPQLGAGNGGLDCEKIKELIERQLSSLDDSDKIRVNISKLKAKGMLERIGADRGGYWKVKLC